jgi:hypothetical protein
MMPLHHWRRRAMQTTLCALLLLLGATASQGDPTLKFDPADWHGYVQQLTRSHSPDARRILREINDGPRDFARARTAAKRAGIPLTWADLQRPMPPADENAAVIYDGLPKLQHQFFHSLVVRPEPDRAFYNVSSGGLTWRKSYTTMQIAMLKDGVARQQAIIDAIHKGTAKLYCVFAPSDGVPISASMREAARTLELESFLLAYDGRYMDAIANAKCGLIMARQVDSPSLGFVSSLIANAVENISLYSIANVLHMAGPNRDAVSAINAVIVSYSTIPMLRRSFVSGVPYDLDSLGSLHRQGPNALPNIYPDSSSKGSHGRYTKADLRLFANLVEALDAADINMTIRLAAHADDNCNAKLALFNKINRGFAGPDADPIEQYETQQQLQMFISIFDYEKVAAIARRTVDLAADKALWVKAMTGSYPDSLSGTFIDPFANKPLQYRKTDHGNGFVVQTINPDMTKFVGTYGLSPSIWRHDNAITFEYPGKPVPATDSR